MATEAKTAAVAEIKGKLTSNAGVVMADYRGLSVKDMQDFRAAVREAGGEVKVYKNTLTEIAIRELAMPSMDEHLVGPTCFVFVADDPVLPAKAIMAFAKEHETFEVKGAFIQNAAVDAATIKAIAALPSHEELIAKLLGTLQNPLTQTVRVLNGPAAAFVQVLDAVQQQKAAA